ncbi:hypothetical protein [Desulfosarcina ovata]|uniref:hypothetical protein n=1 Tax=Desulfosarcina ovata TaxID=83564 RepID=UPI0012D2AA81|nr:hypothetical protein [Desulfosarcina ovata]
MKTNTSPAQLRSINFIPDPKPVFSDPGGRTQPAFTDKQRGRIDLEQNFRINQKAPFDGVFFHLNAVGNILIATADDRQLKNRTARQQ